MAISRDDVDHVAYLARLGLAEDERERLRAELDQILGYMQVLQQLDTSAIPPTAQVIPLQNVMRPDTPRPSLSVEAVFANAPAREEDYFRVAPVLE
ncbi:MAG TPA: Asp-tRNA(Asn)/Glu-tRNA(Gln) amidotransferase subunit GatC [Chloroflexota bacterium]|nr:Asp-tRNA(Asn)/Glu-tRNA(Gln) amidotransferase subunit GatC [Chloroflexota bacterium]